MKNITALLVPFGLLAACTTSTNVDNHQQEESPEHPDVLFLAMDDLRDWTGYLTNFSDVKTPNLDRLAAESMIFSHAYCAAPACGPSRTALLTGKSPSNTGVYENYSTWPDDLREHVSLTRHFMDNGYYVAGFGKIYHGSGDFQQWHRYDLVGEFHSCVDDPDHPKAMGNPFDFPDSLDYDWQRATKTIEIIEQGTSTPLFVACGTILPHLPWNAPRRFFDMYPLDSIKLPETKKDDLEDVPFIGQKIARKEIRDHYCKNLSWTHQEIVDSGLWKINIQAYLASISYADEQIGRILDAWNNSKHAENGIIVLWGDHGYHLGEKERWSKFTLWEVGTRTPLLMKMPGITEPGAVCDVPVNLLDIFPTLVDACNLSPRNDLDGLSLLPLLRDPDLQWDRGSVTIHGKDNVAVRTKDWRYIHYCDGSKELYYHPDDPNEWNNLANDPDYMPIINELHKWVPECVPATPPRRNKQLWFVKEDLTCD